MKKTISADPLDYLTFKQQITLIQARLLLNARADAEEERESEWRESIDVENPPWGWQIIDREDLK